MSNFRRALPVVAASVGLLAVSGGAVGCNAQWQRMEGVGEACQRIFDKSKFDFDGYHWDWLPPAWVCEFTSADDHYERRLPFGQR